MSIALARGTLNLGCRGQGIRDSFPNPAQMWSALLALIQLFDPSIDIKAL